MFVTAGPGAPDVPDVGLPPSHHLADVLSSELLHITALGLGRRTVLTLSAGVRRAVPLE